jgi:hypothetical protein
VKNLSPALLYLVGLLRHTVRGGDRTCRFELVAELKF